LEHLNKFKKELVPKGSDKDKVGRKPGKYQWYEIQDSTDYWKIFLGNGIMFPHFNKYSNFTYTSGGFFPNNKAYVMATTDLFLLGVLNSKLMNFYLRSICPFVRGEYYEYMPQYVEKFPITRMRSFEKEIVYNVDYILDANRKIVDIKNKVIRRLSDNLKISITTRLYNFHRFSFRDLIKELEKQKIRLSLEQQDEWDKYIKTNSTTINNLLAEISRKDEEIEQNVFASYGLTKSEIKRIEEAVE
jgi:hypothetical protein